MVRTAHDPGNFPSGGDYAGRSEGHSTLITPILFGEPLIKFSWWDWCREMSAPKDDGLTRREVSDGHEGIGTKA